MKILTGLLWTGAALLAQPSSSVLTTLHSFSGGNDGVHPYATVTTGGGGRLYGTTFEGGTHNVGVVYSLTPPASPGGAWKEAVIHDFDGTDGGEPTGTMVAGTGGVLYGTTVGKKSYGGRVINGTVFSLTPPAAAGGSWGYTVLYNFGDFSFPLGSLAIGSGGVLYGTTQVGGTYGQGTVFSLSPPASPGGAWTEAALYSFGRTGNPFAGVAVDGGGVLYGAVGNDVFSLTPPASPGGAWKQAVLYTFSGGADGGNPGAVAIGTGGVLYGMTTGGGSGTCGLGCGTVFSLTPPAFPGGAWTETVIHSFLNTPDGAYPYNGAGLSIGVGGVLYGATEGGGTANDGTVFSLAPPATPGGSWTETVLHSFTGADGSGPYSSPVIGHGGVLYGTTNTGGTANYGTVFSLKP